MRKTLISVLAAVATVPLAFLAATPASAAPEDVTAAFTSSPGTNGLYTITGTFTFDDGAGPQICGFRESDDDEVSNSIVYVNGGANSATATKQGVPAGVYAIEWYCDDYASDTTEYWGTPGLIYPGNLPTATTQALVVGPAEEEPEVPEPGCTGSVCLPTGSFGF